MESSIFNYEISFLADEKRRSHMIHVAVDAMGGDNAPGEIVKGAVQAVNKRSDIHVLLVGQEEAVKKNLFPILTRRSRSLWYRLRK